VKYILIFFVNISFLFASEHFAKIEPYETITLKAQASGEILKSLKAKEGKIVSGTIIQIDDSLDQKNLQSTQDSLVLTKRMIKLNKEIAADLRKNMEKKRELYERVVPLSSSSVSQKDSLYSAYIAAKSQYSGTLEKILNLKSKKVSLEQKLYLIQDTITKKSVRVNSKYLYRINVEAGEFVTIGVPLATVMDLSRGKVTLYLDADELKGIEKKKIYIDGSESSAKIKKIWRVADTHYISSYRVEIEVSKVKEFSKVVKVEFK